MAEEGLLQGASTPIDEANARIFKPRAYQQEMLTESLRRNIIVAMETGSGKTQIAILRVQEEIMRCSPDKLVWFLAPTVALAEQQYAVFCKQLPLYQSRLLLGSDNVDHWSTQKIWDKILLNQRIVVSTPQVLLNAMSSGFVKLSKLALLVFDEAHRCIGASPFNGIMRLYHHARLTSEYAELPGILGLTASPAAKATAAAVKLLEENLHAICRTPVAQREELLKHTHTPEIVLIKYQQETEERSELLNCLDTLLYTTFMDIENDPYIKLLRVRKDPKSQATLEKTLESGKTFTRTEIESLTQRAQVLQTGLGSWAADVFVATCTERFIEGVVKKSNNNVFRLWDDAEKVYMMNRLSILQPAMEGRRWGSQPDEISHKAELLVRKIVESFHPGYRIIVFAEQRATVIMLAHMLSVHPLMEGIITAHFLGSSSYAKRKSNITELFTPRDQKNAVNDLRSGKINVLVATSVLEEGIDVPACNMVICFDPPKELRSFIQRRGRARDQESKLILLIDGADTESVAKWITMEEHLKKIYADDQRLLEEIKALEDIEEDSTEFFRIPTTDAVLHHQNAREYLAYFCATITCAFIDNRPDFVIARDDVTDEVTAKVVLPSYLDPSLRVAHSKFRWRTEKRAKRDAAFQAYLALYKAGLVNDNLMPIHRSKHLDPENTAQEKQVKLVKVSECWDPWADIAHLRRSDVALIPTRVCFEANPLGLPDMVMLLPKRLPCDWEFELFWNEEISFKARLCYDHGVVPTGSNQHSARFTHEILYSTYQGRITWKENDYVTLFWPEKGLHMPVEQWVSSIEGEYEANDAVYCITAGQLDALGLARSNELYSRPFLVERIVHIVATDDAMEDIEGDEDTAPKPEPHIQGRTLPKRADFLHTIFQDAQAPLAHTTQQCIPLRSCSISRLPVKFSKFALFVPSITHKVETLYIAERLARTILSRVKFQDLSHVLTAISASVAREPTDYQRYEFLGDSLLKFITSIQLTAANPLWHEGLLSAAKDNVVSNDRLSQAARRIGLDQYILTKPFTGRKWRPSRVSDFDEAKKPPNAKRELSTKVLADVVEALLGAAYLDGGIDKMSTCARVFLPEVEWTSLEEGIRLLNQGSLMSDVAEIHPKLAQMEEILGHKFTKPSLLLEALTHPCCQDEAGSYQRLEFLGDSVLDHLVVQELFNNAPTELSHQDMHLMRTTLVNADFLAFLCLSLYIVEEREEAAVPGMAHVSIVKTEYKTYLWQMMRHGASWEIVNAQQETMQRYQTWSGEVDEALQHASTYPWAGLFRINAGKFFSDIIESILGAIFVDSHGSLDTCRGFLERIGLFQYLRRIIRGDIELLHPRNQLYIAAKSAKVLISTRTEKLAGQGQSDADCELVYICRIRVDDEDIIEVGDGINKLEVETRAAALAAEILRSKSLLLQRMDESEDSSDPSSAVTTVTDDSTTAPSTNSD
ncbi:putative RNA helicase/RNAse III [Talaromyces proteolyticus]|uniref:RNA helicase/RNAse III n=1 Tax=Talaromyces proteolyticus TaxID=1131652 RepID=A0AAD4Q6X7_9EURO|nr:putative RNA helicase/RNAse III [Talaromyces proteolyticus]KAH8705777.1 putative RNA helicase/RNAse III [Talaromyces proteolyticus]